MIREAVRNVLPESVLDRLRRTRAWLKNLRYPRRVVEHTFGSLSLKIELADPTAESWYDRNWPVMGEIEELRSGKLRSGARVFNLGAHQGVVALVLADEVGDQGAVVAIEPVAHNVEVARRNVRRNRYTNVIVRRGLVSDQTGSRTFSGAMQARLGGGSQKTESVTVDALSREYGNPDVVYVDVEGAEALVLRGATDTLHTGCDWFVEVHEAAGLGNVGGSVDEILTCFRKCDYQVSVAAPERTAEFIPLREANPKLLENRFVLVARPR